MTLKTSQHFRQKSARLIAQERDIFSNISEGMVLFLQGVTENDSSLKCGEYEMTSEKIDNKKRLIDRANDEKSNVTIFQTAVYPNPGLKEKQ